MKLYWHCSLRCAAGDLWTGISHGLSILVPQAHPPPSGLTSHQTEAGTCEYDCGGWPHHQCQVTCPHVSGYQASHVCLVQVKLTRADGSWQAATCLSPFHVAAGGAVVQISNYPE